MSHRHTHTTHTPSSGLPLWACIVMLGSIAVTPLASTQSPPPQQRIAVINLERAIYATSEAERRIAKLRRDEEYKDQRATVESLRADGQRLVEQVRKNEAVLSEARKRELQRRITTVREDVEYALKKLQTMEQTVVDELRDEMSDNAQAALEQLMKEEEVSILLRRHPNVPVILYADSKYDLTLKLTDMLNRTDKSPSPKASKAKSGGDQ